MARFSKGPQAFLNKLATAPREFIVSKKGSEMASKAAALVEREHPEEADDFLVELVMLGYHPSGYVGSGPANIYGGKRKYKRLEENPSGGAWALGIAAVLGLGWLLLRPKKAEAAPTPTTTPPTNPRDATTPAPPVFLPITIVGCTINQTQWESWTAAALRNGPWLTQSGTPPDWATIQAQYPYLQNVPPERGAVMTGNGAQVWLYGSFGIPFARADARQNICDWVKDPSTPILVT